MLVPSPLWAAPAAEPQWASPEAIFLFEMIVLLVCGRLLGEAMQRIGQPAVMGQLIAGLLLGPSVLGALWPDLQQSLFPQSREQKAMLDAVLQLGILMLLLLTGMETDLSVVKRLGRAAVSVSIAGVSLPFACGFALGELLPETLLPAPDLRLITSLFLGTALSISSVKIVAMVVREMNFMRRTVGQVIVASAIIDDTIGWTIMAVTFGLASHGRLDVASLVQSVLGTALFLLASFTIGRRAVSLLIRWVNDTLVSDVPVITTILVVTATMALITHAIGVHTVLGAFVAGILIGQSPILTRHIDDQLRGLIIALFMPVFFGLAGLNANLAIVKNPSLLLLSLGFIVIASLGKFSGAFLGGAFGGLTWRESLAIGCGMNARGSTEVIVASIGLSMGALSQDLYTMIVVMAVVTTMAMPPMLRWALAHLPLAPEEESRLEREAVKARGFVTSMERLLVAADESATGRSRLALSASSRAPGAFRSRSCMSGQERPVIASGPPPRQQSSSLWSRRRPRRLRQTAWHLKRRLLRPISRHAWATRHWNRRSPRRRARATTSWSSGLSRPWPPTVCSPTALRASRRDLTVHSPSPRRAGRTGKIRSGPS
jgi:Kef-type K+ transport system membrane component KefB